MNIPFNQLGIAQIDPNGGLGGLGGARDCAQPSPKFPLMPPQKPTLREKLGKVAEMYELELLCFDDALKAAEKAFTQHIKRDEP